MANPSVIPALEQLYEAAPATSHLYGWLIRSTLHDEDTFVPPAPGVVAVITVAFKLQVNGRYVDQIAAAYEYPFHTLGEAGAVMGALSVASHPGEIIDRLVKSGNRGRKVYSV